MQQLQLVAYGEPSDVIELNRIPEPALGQEDVLVSMEAAPINPSDFLLVRGIYGVRPALPFSMGSEGVGRVVKTGSKVDVALQGKRVLILPTYDHITGQPARIAVPVLIDVLTAYLIGALRKCETYAERQQ
jgi:NADPH:quinone reductase-like Zn-dependent oxidoreductase